MYELKRAPTSFIGRADEIDELGALLDDPACRLLTLVGPGGIGKTRLALEVASRKRPSFPGGIVVVPLAPLGCRDDMLAAIAEATPFRLQQDSRGLQEQFFDYLRDKHAQRLLLVLDNIEHLLDGVAIISAILAATTNLKILVTSREVLNLQEEWIRHITGLAYPNSNNGEPLDRYSAVQLFVDRARRIGAAVDLAEARGSVAEICRLVEGMPLAIELAAGWLKVLRPAEIALEIHRSVDILITRSRNLPERHRSIRSVFGCSWRLLSEHEREVFQKLPVFRGGFTREAAEAVAGASLHTLAGLVDKSLVRLNAAGRYDVHELLRQYSAEQLHAAGQRESVQRAYIDYYLGALRRLEGNIKGQQQIQALNTIEADFENVRNAWQLALQQGHSAALDAAVESLHLFADMRGRYHEVVTLLRAALEQLPHCPTDQQTSIRCRIQARLIRLTLLGNMRIDADLRVLIDTCLAAAHARQDQAEVGFCLLVSGIVAVWKLDDDRPWASGRALALFQESYAVYEALDATFYRAEALSWVASATDDNGAHHSGTEILRQSLDLRRAIGDRNGMAWITLSLTEAMLVQLDYAACERYAREALVLMRDIGSVKGVIQALFKLAATTAAKGDLEEARTLAEQLRGLADEINNLDGKAVSAGLLAFLICVMDEHYTQGAALAESYRALSLEPFFAGHNDLVVRWGQAVAACGLGQYEAARLGYAALWGERPDDPGPATVCLAVEAAARAAAGGLEEATELLGLAFHQPVWASGWLERWPLLVRLRADLMSRLGQDAYTAAWERGRRHEPQAIIRSLLDDAGGRPRLTASQPLIEPLSERELQVLGLIAAGLSNRAIAERLVLSVGTVKVHTRNIYSKLSVNSRTQALKQAAKLNLL